MRNFASYNFFENGSRENGKKPGYTEFHSNTIFYQFYQFTNYGIIPTWKTSPPSKFCCKMRNFAITTFWKKLFIKKWKAKAIKE